MQRILNFHYNYSIKIIIKIIIPVTGDLRETSHLLQHLYAALQIGNSPTVFGTLDWNNLETGGNSRLNDGLQVQLTENSQFNSTVY